MQVAIGAIAAIYLIGFGLIFYVNVSSGPVTPGLSAVRAALWFVWVPTGWPQGERERMD
jgi:hypothetical protein